MDYKPNIESVSKHEVPEWFQSAKLGILIHWGVYSVPAYAPVGLHYPDDIKNRPIDEFLRKNPYAEWYLNTLRIDGSPTQKYHRKTYGENFSYDDFIPIFNEESQKWNPNDWVNLFKKIGARYVILVTKHHDGFCLWQSKYKNPKKGHYCSRRNIVAELTSAVKKKGLEMGYYYSGGLDWSVNPNPIKDGKGFVSNVVSNPKYIEYANNQWYELIDDYEPLILWNDIAYPPNTNINEIFAHFYNKFPQGVINDRWRQPQKGGTKFHYDYKTPEYKTFKRVKKQKWELTRGIGSSFSYNQLEKEEDYLSSEELIRLLIDVVSKNGNLLLNVGPKADGTIPEIQINRLLELGKWLEVNGEAIFGTRPWERAEGITSEGIPVRFTQKSKALYAILMNKPLKTQITLKDVNLDSTNEVTLLGFMDTLAWKQNASDLIVELPRVLPEVPAISLKIKWSFSSK
ncbi:MAG: alpha-L-fucosidase [Candidatus Lokiarchaeota archaeon]|nr:alpha-L-fucosidase [Candidatus Lokiarchaeota archaeon]MBD3337930.1 alpha-L-fucosidase [Candidatus Lokiarchaeota archaeon]